MNKRRVYSVGVKVLVDGKEQEVDLGIADDLDAVKNVLHGLLVALEPDALESVVITPLDIEEE
jgi:hypothetical protein